MELQFLKNYHLICVNRGVFHFIFFNLWHYLKVC